MVPVRLGLSAYTTCICNTERLTVGTCLESDMLTVGQ